MTNFFEFEIYGKAVFRQSLSPRNWIVRVVSSHYIGPAGINNDQMPYFFKTEEEAIEAANVAAGLALKESEEELAAKEVEGW